MQIKMFVLFINVCFNSFPMADLLFLKQRFIDGALDFARGLIGFLANTIPGWGWLISGFLVALFIIIGGRLVRLGSDESSIYLLPVRLFGRLARWAAWSVLVLLAVAFMFLGVVVVSTLGQEKLTWFLSEFWPGQLQYFVWGSGAGVVAGLLARWWFIGRILEPWVNNKLDRHTRHRQDSDRLSDIRTVAQQLPDSTAIYDPRQHYKHGFFFVGLDECGEPVYIPFDIWYNTHGRKKGATRTGKGVAQGNLGAQGTLFGDAVIMLDPKGDEWLPHVMRAAAKEAGVNFHLLNLRPGAPAQFNILSGTNAEDLELLLDAGLGFEETGNKGSDYYSKIDRQTLRRSVELFAGKDISLPESRGLDLEAAVEAGDVIYVIGSMLNTRVVKLQKMLLLRFLRIVERRDGLQEHRQVTIYLDEFKYFISRIALNALGTVLQKKCNVVLSHQTDGDLRACPGIDPEEVIGVVQSNAQVRIFYRQDLPADAEQAAAMTGLKLVDKERRKVGRNEELAEVVEPERLVDEVQIPLFDTNLIQSLPPRCAVVFTPGEMARIAITAPYPCKRLPMSPTDAEPLPTEAAQALKPETLI